MSAIQLELDLWQALQVAEQSPEQTDVVKLCKGLEAAIWATPPDQKLQTAARAFLQIAEIFALRSQLLLTDWEQSHSEECEFRKRRPLSLRKRWPDPLP